MNSNCQTSMQQQIIDAASEGFLQHGYHGFSIQRCADKVGLQKGSLYYYVQDKTDLADKVLTAVIEQAAIWICGHRPMGVTVVPESLAVLPMQLWPEPTLQPAIQAYYQDWYYAFYDEMMASFSTTHQLTHHVVATSARERLLTWLGSGVARFMQLPLLDRDTRSSLQ